MDKNEIERVRLELIKEKERLQYCLPHLYGFKHYKWSREFYESTNRLNFLCAGNQLSKAQDVNELVPTPCGFKRMGDIGIGDYVFAQDGSATKVISVPYRGISNCYRVIFSDGSCATVSGAHEWVCKTSKERFTKEYKSRWPRGDGRKWANPSYGQWVVLTTKQIIESGGYTPDPPNNKRKVSVPICGPVTGGLPTVPTDPYLLGLLLGDGCFRGDTITMSKSDDDKSVLDYMIKFGAKRTSDTLTHRFPIEIRNQIEALGLRNCLSSEKFIPDMYLSASEKDRLALLNGLMDTDGTATSKHSVVSYTTTSPKLAEDVRTLACSLGATVKTKKRKAGYRNRVGEFVRCKDAYTLSIKMEHNPFRLKRKADFHRPDIRYKHERVIERIEPVGEIECQCITVEHDSGTFLTTKDYIVTHNSSASIRKCIHWATSPDLWPSLWKTKPNTFWYMYPSREVTTIEVTQKWVKEFLPMDEMKEHNQYGWELEKRDRWVWAIHFKTGVSVFFKTYRQDAQMLQAGTSWAVFTDEEMGWELFPEVSRRLAATRGYFHMVFTATLGQIELKDIIEGSGNRQMFPGAARWQVSMYDCQTYEDGTPSIWTAERIQEEINAIGDQREIDRRINGKFVLSSGLKYPGFTIEKNLKVPLPIETYQSWHLYAGVDLGSGSARGSENVAGHPAAITFVAVRPDFKYGRIFRGWIGLDVETSAGDVYNKYLEMSSDLNMVQQFYDYAAKDFLLISQRAGTNFEAAEKGTDAGEMILNTLFKNGMLDIDDIPELQALVRELVSLSKGKKKGDDFSDSLRYAVVRIPWNFTALRGLFDIVQKPKASKVEGEFERVDRERDEARKAGLSEEGSGGLNEIYEEEIEAWNELYES